MRLRTLSHREKLLIGAAALLFALVGLVTSLFLPLVSRLHTLEQEVAKGEQVVLRLRELEPQESALDRQLAELRSAAARQGLDASAPFGPAQVLVLLQSAQETSGLSWEELSFSPADKGSLRVQATGSGGYRALSEFLQALRRFPHTSAMSLASLQPAKTGVSFRLEVTFRLNPIEPQAGPAAPPPAAGLRLSPLPPRSEGRENPFAPAQYP